MNDKNRKAMFAKSVFRNHPAIPSDHYLANPKNADDALSLRLAKRYSAKQSDLKNKHFLSNQTRWKSVPFHLDDPNYIRIGNERNESNYYSNENDEKRKENDKKLEEIHDKYNVDWHTNQKNRASAGKAGGVYYRHAWTNERKVQDAIDAKEGYEPLWEKGFKQKVKGYNPKFTPDHDTNMFFKLYDIEKKETEPIRERLKELEKEQKEIESKHYATDYGYVRNPVYKKNSKERLDAYNKLTQISEKYIAIRDSVDGHEPKFKR